MEDAMWTLAALVGFAATVFVVFWVVRLLVRIDRKVAPPSGRAYGRSRHQDNPFE